MEKIENLQQYLELIKNNKARLAKRITNSCLIPTAMDDYIQKGMLYYEWLPNGMYVLVDEGSYYNQYYFWEAEAELTSISYDKPVLIEIIGKGSKENVGNSELDEKLAHAGFSLCKINHQYEMMTDEQMMEQIRPLYLGYLERMKNEELTFAGCSDNERAADIIKLWKENLDLTDVPGSHLGFMEDKKASVVCVLNADQEVVGAYWYEKKGKDKAEGRHIVVRADYCRRGIALALLTKAAIELQEAGIRRFLTWIADENHKSILLHQKAGFIRKEQYSIQYIKNNS